MKDLITYINKISPIKEDTLITLVSNFRSVKLSKNDYFVREGEVAQRIGFLINGMVRSFFIDPSGKEYTKQFFVGPSIIGAYSSLLNKKPNRIAQQALTDCEVLVANYKEIENLYDQFHDLERLGRKISESYFLEKEEKEIQMALLDADKRYLIMREKFPTIESTIPQYHIASYLGISPTQLSRIRKKLYDN